jgi:peptidoglycan/xylan/chitin deacetylase (PgdA/CDA1 family)
MADEHLTIPIEYQEVTIKEQTGVWPFTRGIASDYGLTLSNPEIGKIVARIVQDNGRDIFPRNMVVKYPANKEQILKLLGLEIPENTREIIRVEPQRVETDSKKPLYIAITSDDGPYWNTAGKSYTQQFIEFFEGKKIKVTWFIQYGRLLSREMRGFNWRNKKSWIDVYKTLQDELKHEIGIHSYSANFINDDHAAWLPYGTARPKPIGFTGTVYDSFSASLLAAKNCLTDLRSRGLKIKYGRPPGGWISELTNYIKYSRIRGDPLSFLNELSSLGLYIWPGKLEREPWRQDWHVELDDSYPFNREFEENFIDEIRTHYYCILLTHDNAQKNGVSELRQGIEWIESTYNNIVDIKYVTLSDLETEYFTIRQGGCPLPS